MTGGSTGGFPVGVTGVGLEGAGGLDRFSGDEGVSC